MPKLRRPKVEVDPGQYGHYGGAMSAAKQAVDDLEQLRDRHAPAAEFSVVHKRLDRELGIAAAAATAVHDELLAAGNYSLRTERNPDVGLWKRRMNTVLTLRSKHQLSESDDAGSRVVASARVRSRAAYGPHQPGMDFDNEPL